MKKRLLVWTLVLCMIVGMLPVSALATDEPPATTESEETEEPESATQAVYDSQAVYVSSSGNAPAAAAQRTVPMPPSARRIPTSPTAAPSMC